MTTGLQASQMWITPNLSIKLKHAQEIAVEMHIGHQAALEIPLNHKFNALDRG